MAGEAQRGVWQPRHTSKTSPLRTATRHPTVFIEYFRYPAVRRSKACILVMKSSTARQNTGSTPIDQIKAPLVEAPNSPDLQTTKCARYSNIVLGLLIVAAAMVVAITAYSVLSGRKSAELRYDLNDIVLGLLVVAVTIVVAIAAFLLSNRKSAILMDAKDRRLTLVVKDKNIEIKRIKQEKDEQIAQIQNGSDSWIAVAEQFADLAKQRADEIEKENLKLKQKLADKEKLELEQKLANRRITEQQHKILVDILSKKPGQIIIETMGDPESGLFAEDIFKTFIDSGWKVRGRFPPQNVVWTGLIFYKSADPDAATVMQVLKCAGIPFSVGSETRATATITVGGKLPLF